MWKALESKGKQSNKQKIHFSQELEYLGETQHWESEKEENTSCPQTKNTLGSQGKSQSRYYIRTHKFIDAAFGIVISDSETTGLEPSTDRTLSAWGFHLLSRWNTTHLSTGKAEACHHHLCTGFGSSSEFSSASLAI